MNRFLSYLTEINGFLWGGPLLLFLLGTHIYFTFRTKGIQRKLPLALKLSISPSPENESKKSLGAFSSLATTLAATLGTGNIIGISTAVALGGPGAVFWCWLTGVLGMSTTYVECHLNLYFRETSTNGSFFGGPMYLLKNQCHLPKTAKLYAYLLLLSSFMVGCSTQSQAAAETMQTVFALPPFLTGSFLALVTGLVLLGGFSGIGSVCTWLVPGMGLFYLTSCLFLLILTIPTVPDAVQMIFSSAFSFSSIGGGLVGSSLLLSARYGIARGLFTNEAGLGSAAVAAANSSGEPKKQALVLMSATFWDTVVMCGITGLVIVSAGLSVPGLFTDCSAGDYTFAAFSLLPFAGKQILAVSILLFAFATLLGWSFFGEKAAEFLFGRDLIKTYRFLYCLMILLGSCMTLTLVWELSDLFNALMIVPNVLSLYLLQRHLPKE